MRFDQPPVVRVKPERRGDGPPLESWLLDVPAVQQVLRDGLDLAPGVTFLVGENGAGKSTLVEAVAMAYGLSPEGGSTQGWHRTRPSESALHGELTLQRGVGTGSWGFFLRAETMHGWYTYQEGVGGHDLHAMSHGESFLEVLRRRFDSPGFYCLDEPEAALSFSSSLTLLRTLHDIAEGGGQVLCATHSPIVASLPGARVLEVGPWGLRETTWDDLDLVHHWRAYLAAPGRYLRHVLANDDDE
ncbi:MULTISPECIES: AAA family ATPase [unclassified Aeromicrobium]|uniref:AAA family ATPase n=1 Tax=unclassified Aeromicrobium TaxID=2633570 RepID=UPI00288959F5|nr:MULTISPECIES: AAA family ATPase [unclassified Aeromicrobium]